MLVPIALKKRIDVAPVHPPDLGQWRVGAGYVDVFLYLRHSTEGTARLLFPWRGSAHEPFNQTGISAGRSQISFSELRHERWVVPHPPCELINIYSFHVPFLR